MPPPTSQLPCIARRRLVLARKTATFTVSLCNSSARLPSPNYTISDPASCTRQLSPSHPTTTSQHIVLSRFVLTSTCGHTCSPAQRIFDAIALSHLPVPHIIRESIDLVPPLCDPSATPARPAPAATPAVPLKARLIREDIIDCGGTITSGS